VTSVYFHMQLCREVSIERYSVSCNYELSQLFRTVFKVIRCCFVSDDEVTAAEQPVAFVIARVRVVKFLMPGSILGWKVKAPNDDPGCALEKIYSQGRNFSSLG